MFQLPSRHPPKVDVLVPNKRSKRPRDILDIDGSPNPSALSVGWMTCGFTHQKVILKKAVLPKRIEIPITNIFKSLYFERNCDM